MYKTRQIIINENDNLYDYLDNYAHLAKLLYNAAMFRVRQVFTAYGKDALTPNEQEVMRGVDALEAAYPYIHVQRVISYNHLEKLLRVTRNPDFFSELPMQTAQDVVRSAVDDFKNWLKALRDFHGHPEKYSGVPNIPHYKKQDVCTFTITNQDAVLYAGAENNITELKLPHRKERYILRGVPAEGRLKELSVKPYYGRYLLCLVLETEDVPAPVPGKELAGIDFGVDNIATIACTDGTAAVYKGGAILSGSQKHAKLRAQYTGIITKGHEHMHASSRRLTDIGYHHANFTKDQVHKVSAGIVRWCLEHNVGTFVLGANRQWKTSCRMGDSNNQNFVSMPIRLLQVAIMYKAVAAGIMVLEQEESYTSQADLTAMDYIPTYGVDDDRADFSGKRIHRGLYRTRDGLLVNADCMAAGNILRKAVPDAWADCTDFRFLCGPAVIGFKDLNPSANFKGMAQGA